MGDERTYDYTIALRAVETTDFMTGIWSKIPYEVLEKVSSRIVNEVKHVNRVVYDITSKPPGADVADALEAIATKVYRADGVDFTPAAKRQLAELRENGFGNLPVCVAKTQYSFSDNAKALGAPENFRITVRELKVSAGAHFVVALTGSVLTMPGLPKVPAAENIDVDNDGNITGLF